VTKREKKRGGASEDRTYIDINIGRALAEAHTHGEELCVAARLGLELEAARGIALVDGANVPFEAVAGDLVDGVKRRDLRLVGFVGDRDADVLEGRAARQLVLDGDVEGGARLLDPDAERDGRVGDVVGPRRQLPLHDADAHVAWEALCCVGELQHFVVAEHGLVDLGMCHELRATRVACLEVKFDLGQRGVADLELHLALDFERLEKTLAVQACRDRLVGRDVHGVTVVRGRLAGAGGCGGSGRWLGCDEGLALGGHVASDLVVHIVCLGLLAELHALLAERERLGCRLLVLLVAVVCVGYGGGGCTGREGRVGGLTAHSTAAHTTTHTAAHTATGACRARGFFPLHLELFGAALALLGGLELLVAGNDFLDALLVRLHVKEGLDLAHGQVLAVAESNDLVKGRQQLKRVLEDLALVERLAYRRDNLGEEVQRVDVLQNVGLQVGDEDHVQLVEGLVDVADVVLLAGCMLSPAVGELGERGKESFDARALHLTELAREDRLSAASAYRGCEDHLAQRQRAVGSRAFSGRGSGTILGNVQLRRVYGYGYGYGYRALGV
jgi:hypothetical protein